MMLLLFCKDMRFMLIAEMIVNHAPDRRITGIGYKSYCLNRVLTIKYIINSITAADLYGINLMQIKFVGYLENLRFGQGALIILTRHQIFDWYLLEYHVRHIRIEISIHVLLLYVLQQFVYCCLQAEQGMLKIHSCL